MNEYINALASKELSAAVFDLLSKELHTEWNAPVEDCHVSFCVGQLEHQLSIRSNNHGDSFLTYVCSLYQGISSESALIIASDLNRRLVGVVFVAVPLGDTWSLLAYSSVLLKHGYAHVLFCYVSILKRVIGIVEHIADQNWIREVVGLSRLSDNSATNRLQIPRANDYSATLDPLNPIFATGLWVSNLEASEFHRNMKMILEERNAGFRYVSKIEDSDVAVLNDLKLEMKYILDPQRSLTVVRDYDISVEIKNVRHSELGFGLQEVQQYAYFASDAEPEDGFGSGLAHGLANTLNFLTFKDLDNPVFEWPPFLLIGSWNAVNEQVFHGQFIPDVVLEELSQHCVGVFGEALTDLVHPSNALSHANRFINYLEKSHLESKREPNPFRDAWSGCNETLLGKGSLLFSSNEETQNDGDLFRDACAPVFIQLATWGFFGGTEVPVSSLEVIKHPEKHLYWLVYRVRHPIDPRVIVLSGPTTNTEDLGIAPNVEDWFQKLGWPRIDWLIVQAPIANEPVRNGLRHFANALSKKVDVALIVSEIHISHSPWEYLFGATSENVFNEDKSVEAGFEWVVTRPDVVDRSISRIIAMFEHSRATKSGASEIDRIYLQTYFEFVIAIRNGEINRNKSYRDFLDERFESDSATVDQLVSIENQHKLN